MPLPATAAPTRALAVLLNVGHALDHLVLLIFAMAVATIASDFGFARWEDLMPYGAGAFLLFGLGSLPAGRWGDVWGRRQMMLVFYFGLGLSCLLAAFTQNAWQMAAVLVLLGAFASIYHPVGIPMLVRGAKRPGATIGLNGLAGNLGLAAATFSTGHLVATWGWRMAFVVPALVCLVCGLLFWRYAPQGEPAPAAKPKGKDNGLTPALLARVLAVMTAAGTANGLAFNLTTNGNGQLLAERLHGIVTDPAALGTLLAVVYAVASLAQVVVGRLIDRFPLKQLYLGIALLQVPMFVLAAHAQGWALYAALLGVMVLVFGAIPFSDAMIVRYVDDRIRSRVAGMRLAISIGVSSLAVWALGPVVKAAGFSALLLGLAGMALVVAAIVTLLPGPKALRLGATQEPAAESTKLHGAA